MDYTVWQLIIFIIAFGMVLLSAFCAVFPHKLINGMPFLVNSKLARYSDIVIRILFGGALVLSAEKAIIPLIFTILGYLSLVAASTIIILGSSKVEAIVNYITNIFPVWTVRTVCALSVFLFAFLIYNIG